MLQLVQPRLVGHAYCVADNIMYELSVPFLQRVQNSVKEYQNEFDDKEDERSR